MILSSVRQPGRFYFAEAAADRRSSDRCIAVAHLKEVDVAGD
jgi:hypothetical protein